MKKGNDKELKMSKPTIKMIILITIALTVMVNPLKAQELEDVLYLKDGSVVRGLIIETIPNVSIKIRLGGGSELVFKMDEISKITKESNLSKTSKIESWYFHLAIGGSDNSYPEELQALLDVLNDLPNVTHVAISIDFSFYWPLSNEKTLLGVAMSGVTDSYEFDSETFTINHYIYAISAIHYPTEYIGKGLFARADIGTAKILVESSLGSSETSDNGFGFLLGGGYSWPISKGTRFDLMAGFSSRSVESENYSSLFLNVGFMF